MNPNVFGGDSSALGLVGEGPANTSTSLLIGFDISLIDNPSSITVDGTFSVRNAAGTTIATGLGAADIVLSGSLSTNKKAILAVQVSGATANTVTYYLRKESSSSKITVNP